MQQTTAKEAALNIFAILGFIALLIAGLWSTIQLMQIVFGFVGNKMGKTALAPLASLSQPSVEMQLRDTNVAPGKPFAVGWSGKNVTNNGALSFTYACREGLFLKVQASLGTEYAIPCNAPYAIPKDATNLSITPVLARPGKIELPLTLTYTENGKATKDMASITVDGMVVAPVVASQIATQTLDTTKTTAKPVAIAPIAKAEPKPVAVVPVAKPAPAPKPAPVPAPKKTITVEKPVQKSNAAGFVDLEARIVAVGKLAKTGVVSPRTVFNANETVSVTFEIVNNGTKAVSNWVYSLSLPTDPAYTYDSDAQPTLYAGSKATVTISFDKLATNGGQIVLVADPAKVVADLKRANNTAATVVSVN